MKSLKTVGALLLLLCMLIGCTTAVVSTQGQHHGNESVNQIDLVVEDYADEPLVINSPSKGQAVYPDVFRQVFRSAFNIIISKSLFDELIDSPQNEKLEDNAEGASEITEQGDSNKDSQQDLQQTTMPTVSPTAKNTPTPHTTHTASPTHNPRPTPTPCPTPCPTQTPYLWVCCYCGASFPDTDGGYEAWYNHAWHNPGCYAAGHAVTPVPSTPTPMPGGHWEDIWVVDIPAVMHTVWHCNVCSYESTVWESDFDAHMKKHAMANEGSGYHNYVVYDQEEVGHWETVWVPDP